MNEAVPRDRILMAQRLWKDSQSARDTVVQEYLHSRAVELPPAGDTVVRCHPGLFHPTKIALPGMVAAITRASDSTFLGVHRTFLQPDGSAKARISPDRMILGAKKGGVIRLVPDEDISTRLAIAEGIETALTAIAAGWPCWSAIDAGNMATLPVWPWIDLTVFADHDAAGVRSAETLARRWEAAGGNANIIVTQYQGEDWNDVAQREQYA